MKNISVKSETLEPSSGIDQFLRSKYQYAAASGNRFNFLLPTGHER
jgi:hypothetical protein